MEWAHASDDNMHELKVAQRLHDTLLWHHAGEHTAATTYCGTALGSGMRLRAVVRYIVAAAVVAAVAFAASWLYFDKRLVADRHVSELVVPAGQQAMQTLPDGTQVWVGAGSRLAVPVGFSRGNRVVSLNGEALFKVRHDEAHPFVVTAGKYRVQVLGTEFNLRSYIGSRAWEVALLKGHVKVLSGSNDNVLADLRPGMRAFEDGAVLKVDSIRDVHSYQLENGIVCFNNETLLDIFKRLERYYSVKITVKDGAGAGGRFNGRFNGKFRLRDGLEHILHTLQLGCPFRYRMESDQDRVLIY